MISKYYKYLKDLLVSSNANMNDSININDHQLIWRITSQPDFPWLISFPRTGSHWLRMIMELYFEKPSLVEIYYHKDAKEFTCYHRHDEFLTVGGCTNVIYLYREPVDTIYSQLNFEKEDINGLDRIKHWSELYGKHLSKWLFDEKFTTKKTIITYEEMKTDIHSVFKKLCNHFNLPFDKDKLDSAVAAVSKERLKEKTQHTPQVVTLSNEYELNRKSFKKEHSAIIYNTIFAQNEKLRSIFSE